MRIITKICGAGTLKHGAFGFEGGHSTTVCCFGENPAVTMVPGQMGAHTCNTGMGQVNNLTPVHFWLPASMISPRAYGGQVPAEQNPLMYLSKTELGTTTDSKKSPIPTTQTLL